MIKLISKVQCPRCEKVKEFLSSNQIPFTEVMAEDQGYGYWRDLIQSLTGQPGFPLLLNVSEVDGMTIDSVNGDSGEIIKKILSWLSTKEDVKINSDHIKYDWGFWPEEGAPLPRE